MSVKKKSCDDDEGGLYNVLNMRLDQDIMNSVGSVDIAGSSPEDTHTYYGDMYYFTGCCVR